MGRHAAEGRVKESASAWRSAAGAGFALPRDADRRSALQAGGVIREQVGCAFRPPVADGAGVNTGGPLPGGTSRGDGRSRRAAPSGASEFGAGPVLGWLFALAGGSGERRGCHP